MKKNQKTEEILMAPIEDRTSDPNTITTTKIKKQLSKLNDEAELITTSDDDLYTSPQQQSTHNLTWNLDLPSQTSGKISPIDEQRWIIAIENLLARGVNTHQQISKLTGLNPDLSKKYLIKIKEIHEQHKSHPYVYNIVNDGRDCSWNKIQPVQIDNETYKVGFTDCGFFCNRKVLELLAFKINPIPESRFFHNEFASSGVGEQLTRRLNALKIGIYKPIKSLAFHGDHESVMHKELRKKQPIISK